MEHRLRHLVLLVLLFLLNGCALNRLFLSDEIDKVNVVKYTPYVKHHRAYFTRTNLQPVIDHHKYLFLYNPKKQDLALLLHRNGHYLLYSFTKPQNRVLKLKRKGKVSQRSLLRSFAKAGYHIANLTRLGFDAKAGLRRYKGVKTLMIEVKDYRKLKKRYESAIKHYQAAKVLRIRTPLPKKFVNSYLIYYYKRAKTTAQKQALERIAKKLHITLPGSGHRTHKVPTTRTKVPSSTSVPNAAPKTNPATPDATEEDETETISYIEPQPTTKPYPYYLHQASLYELSNYLDDPQNRRDLSYGRYRILKRRLAKLKKEELLQEGSLESLIAAYKKNKNPQFKQRILELLKKKQEEESGS